jgi:8-oxo-dGTP diphosphatase
MAKRHCKPLYHAKLMRSITVDSKDASFMHLLHYVGYTEYMYVFFKVEKWQGTPKIMEPEKCDDLSWFPLSELPENLASITRDVLEKYKEGILYSDAIVQ